MRDRGRRPNREDSTCKKSSRLDSRVSRTTENLRAIVTIPVAESCEASRVVCRGLMRSCGLQRAAVYSARLMHTQSMCICLVFNLVFNIISSFAPLFVPKSLLDRARLLWYILYTQNASSIHTTVQSTNLHSDEIHIAQDFSNDLTAVAKKKSAIKTQEDAIPCLQP